MRGGDPAAARRNKRVQRRDIETALFVVAGRVSARTLLKNAIGWRFPSRWPPSIMQALE